jgi:hypothetical protein
MQGWATAYESNSMTRSSIVIGVAMAGYPINVIKSLVSDHNADPKTGVVRAIDVDRDVHKSGKPDLMPDIADQIRRAAKRGEKRISYIIFDGRIASSRMGWRWRKYRGSNPHRAHLHCSFTKQGDKNGSFFNIPLLGGTE